MKNLNSFIIERLKINKDTKVVQYNYHPKDFDELRSLLEQLLEKRGKDADLNDIDVSQVTSFGDRIQNGKNKGYSGLFYDLDPHNIDISEWNVSKVKDMHYAFYECTNFNCDLSKWNVSDVKKMGCAFFNCTKFNCDLSKWNVSDVRDMHHMFYKCKKFDCNLFNWNVSNVKDMHGMFYGCEIFKGEGLENWKPIKCKYIYQMFYQCKNLDCDLENWDVSEVKDMDNMFDWTGIENYPSWYKE